MSRPVSANTVAEAALSRTRPLYLVKLGFATPKYWSTREQVSYAGQTWTAQDLRVDLTGKSLSILNAGLALTADFLAGASGLSADVWALYGESPWSTGEAEHLFGGEIRSAPVIAERIEIRLGDRSPKRIPRLTVAPPVFNHLPADGLRIETPGGVFVLERTD